MPEERARLFPTAGLLLSSFADEIIKTTAQQKHNMRAFRRLTQSTIHRRVYVPSVFYT